MAISESEYGATVAIAQPHVHISWRAIAAGIVVALAVNVLLTLLGFAVGLTAFEPTERAAKGVGMGLGIWLIISAIASVFAGAYYGARVAGDPWKGDGVAHGVAVWAGFLLISLWLFGSGLGRLLSSAEGLASSAMSALSSPATTEQAITALTNLGYPRADAERMVQQSRPVPPSGSTGQAQTQAQTQERARRAADEAAAGGAVASWVAFGIALLSFGGGALGGMLGAIGERKQVARLARRRELDMNLERPDQMPPAHPIG